MKKKILVITRIHPSLLPDRGCNVTSCLMLLLLCFSAMMDWPLKLSQNKPFLPYAGLITYLSHQQEKVTNNIYYAKALASIIPAPHSIHTRIISEITHPPCCPALTSSSPQHSYKSNVKVNTLFYPSTCKR